MAEDWGVTCALREEIFQHVVEHSDAFRKTAVKNGFTVSETKFLLQNGWNIATQKKMHAVSDDSETSFLLRALDSLAISGTLSALDASIERAKAFALTGANSSGEYREFTVTEQFRHVALGELVYCKGLCVISERVLAHWNDDSAYIFLVSMKGQEPRAPEYPQKKQTVCLAEYLGGGTNRVEVFLSLATRIPNALETPITWVSEWHPRVHSFSLCGFLSAGRKPVLRI